MTQAETEVPMHILKQSTCPSLSGLSELTYDIGSDKTGLIAFRLTSNSGNGKFNTDWVALSEIEKLIAERQGSKTLSAAALRPLYKGKSTNSPSFLFAVLLTESIVCGGPDRDSGYQVGDIPAFRKAVSALTGNPSGSPSGAVMANSASRQKRGAKGGT